MDCCSAYFGGLGTAADFRRDTRWERVFQDQGDFKENRVNAVRQPADCRCGRFPAYFGGFGSGSQRTFEETRDPTPVFQGKTNGILKRTV